MTFNPQPKAARCINGRCKHIQDKGLLVCGSCARELVDKAFAITVRARGRCQDDRPEHRKKGCRGVLQCAHGFSRRYGGTAWDERNCFCLCAGAHDYYTRRPHEWDDYMHRQLDGLKGAPLLANEPRTLYQELKALAYDPTGLVRWGPLLARFGLEKYIQLA